MPRSAWIVLVVAAVAFFAGLDRAAIGDADEAYYAEAAREMIEGGDFLTPHYNYENRFQKPVLFYWAVAAAYLAAGVGAAAARVPSALSGIGIAAIAWYPVADWYADRTGLIAGLIVATSFGCVAMARQSLPDLPLAFFITASIGAAGVALFDSGPLLLTPLLLSAAAAGLGFLTKGPVGLVLPLAVVAPIAVLERRDALRPKSLLLAVLMFAVIALPWYAGMTMVHGTDYLLKLFSDRQSRAVRHQSLQLPAARVVLRSDRPRRSAAVDRLRAALDSRDRPPRSREGDAFASHARLMVWALFPLVLFSVSVGKQPRYVLPILPPVALLLAAALDARVPSRERRSGGPLLVCCALAAGAFVVAVGVVLLSVPAEALGLDRPALRVAASATMIAGVCAIAAAIWLHKWIPASVATAAVAQSWRCNSACFQRRGRTSSRKWLPRSVRG